VTLTSVNYCSHETFGVRTSAPSDQCPFGLVTRNRENSRFRSTARRRTTQTLQYEPELWHQKFLGGENVGVRL